MVIKKENETVEPLVVERTFDASVGQVWRAITNGDDVGQWFFEMKSFKAEVGHKFVFSVEDKGFEYRHHCEVKEVIPRKKLSYSWRYDGYEGNSLVTFELFPEGSQTRLKLTHEGLETFPPLPAFAKKNFVEGWTALIGSQLKNFLENTADREIVISRVFDAPRELVWEAWINPKHVVNWWGPRGFTTTIHEMDVCPGGVWKLTMHGPDGRDYPNKSVFIEVVKPERIIFTHSGGSKGSPGAQFEAAWTFEAQGGKTKVTMRGVFLSKEERDLVVKTYGAIEGGQQTLARLDEYLATLK